MRSSLRLLKEVTPLQGSRTRYVCSVCRQEARPRPLVARQFLRNASDSSTPMTERVRRKLWGTDNPPGLKDPYGGEGHFEKKFKKSQASGQEPETQKAAAEEVVEEDPLDEAASGDYEPATTWDGLERVGHLGKWSDLAPAESDAYEPFFSTHRLTKPGHLALAAHQAAVELCLMHSLNKRRIESICEVVEHEKAVFDLIRNCKVQSREGQWGSALVYPDEETKKALVYIFQQIGTNPKAPNAEEAAEEAAEEVEEAEESAEIEDSEPVRKVPFFGYEDVTDKGFLELSLQDPKTKFAFLKRFYQLTGHYFPDVTIGSLTTVAQVIDHIEKALAPKPKKLADHLVGNEKLTSLPNVKISVKKVKPFMKDQELGRKKLIDAELRARGLIR
ncbi:ribosomal subunit 39S-domain-containing protein [Aspergillus unguis]